MFGFISFFYRVLGIKGSVVSGVMEIVNRKGDFFSFFVGLWL